MDLFQRFIFGNGGGSPPIVELRWDDTSTTEDRVCIQQVCTYTIEPYATDPDNDIVQIEVFMSTDLGASWNSIISNIGGSTFGDQITTGAKWYKVVVTDAEGNSVTSNILKIVKQLPQFGDIVLVYNNVQYQEWNMSVPGLPPPINMTPSSSGGNTITFAFKNIHPTDFVQCVGINMTSPPLTTNAMSIHKYGDPSTAPIIATSPQDGEIIMPNNSLPGAFQKDSHSGLYVITFHQVQGQWGGSNLTGAISWLINIGANNTCSKYRATNYNDGGGWPNQPQDVDIQIINCSGNVETKTIPAGYWNEIGSPPPGGGNSSNYVLVPGELEFCALNINNANGTAIQPISGTCP